MEERLRLGVSNGDLAQSMSQIPKLNYLGDFSHDNIELLDLLSQKDWVCNLQPVQDIMDMTSRACGQHCLYYLMNRYCKSELNLEDLIKCIYNKRDLKANDVMVTVFCESILFKNK